MGDEVFPLVYTHVILFGHFVSTHPHSSTYTYVNWTVLWSEQTSSTFALWLLFSWQQVHLCSISLASKEYLQKWDFSYQPVVFPNSSVFAAPNARTTKEQNFLSIFHLFFCLFITAFPQDAIGHAEPDPLTPAGKIPVTSVDFGLG